MLLGKLVFITMHINEKLSKAVLFSLGFFLELSIFEIIAFPFALLKIKVSILAYLFVVVLTILCVASICIVKERIIRWRWPVRFEWIYFSAFSILLIWQLYNAVAIDFTWAAADDYAYVTWANDAVTFDNMFTVNCDTGIADRIPIYRAMQASLMFPAILSVLSGVPVIIVEHSILQVFYLILAYTVYCYMAEMLFKSPEDRLVFLIFTSLLFIFGYYGNYNTSFRLLMPNYQGKAVLAVSFIPLVLSMMVELLQSTFDWKCGWVLFFLSASAVSLTLIGAIAIIAIVAIPICFSMFRKERNWKHLRYIPMASILPLIYISVFLFSKYAM